MRSKPALISLLCALVCSTGAGIQVARASGDAVDAIFTASRQLYELGESGNPRPSRLPEVLSAQGKPMAFFFGVSSAKGAGQRTFLLGLGAKKVIANSDQMGGTDLYTSDPSGKNLRQLTDGLQVIQAVFSPRGKVAYVTRKLELYVVDRDGKNRRFIAHATTASWSSDGEKIVYAHLDKPFEALGFTCGIAETDLRRGTETVYTSGFDDGMPIYTPDGRAVVFFGAGRTGLASAYRLDLQTRKVTQLTNINHVDIDFDFVPIPNNPRTQFSADGQTLAFYTQMHGEDSHEAWVIKLDPTGQRVLKASKVGDGYLSKLAPDGKSVTVVEVNGEPKLFRHALDD